MILNLTLGLITLSAIVHRTNVNLGIGTSGIVVHSRILVDNPSGSVWGGHNFNFGFDAVNATGHVVEAPIGSTIILNVQAAGQSR